MFRINGCGVKKNKFIVIQVQDDANDPRDLQQLLPEEEQDGDDVALSVLADMNMPSVIAVDRIAKLCNRNCFYITFVVILCCTMITLSRLQQTLSPSPATADEDLYFLRLNPFLDSFIRPDNETCLICPKRLQIQCEILDNLERPGESKADLRIVYFITSAPGHWRQRSAIRETYGSVAHPHPVFITGHTGDATEMQMLANEAILYKDIIVEDFVDSYWNLTLKTGFILKQFLRLCPQADFLVKADDDVFLQPHVIEQVLATARADQLTGALQQGALPYRDPTDKYYLPYWLYNRSVLPDFLSGTTYIMPGRRVPEILETSFSVPLLNLEDVFFTGIVAQTLNLPLMRDQRFCAKAKEEGEKDLCVLRRLAGYHQVSSKVLLDIWPKVQNLTNQDCDIAGGEESN